MRISRALKSLIDGVSDVIHTRRNKRFLESMENMRIDPDLGLTRRAPTDTVMLDYSVNYNNDATYHSNDISFDLGLERFRMDIKHTRSDDYLPKTIEFTTEQGVIIPYLTGPNSPTNYLLGASTRSDFSIETQQSTVFLLNRKAQPEMKPWIKGNRRDGAFLINRAFEDNESVTYYVSDNSHVIHSLTLTACTGCGVSARDIPTMAQALVTQINGAGWSGVLATWNGGSAVYVRNATGEYPYLQTNNDVMTTIKGFVDDITYLPTYAYPGMRLGVGGQSHKGYAEYYVEARNKSTPDESPIHLPGSTQAFTVTAGIYRNPTTGEKITGYSFPLSIGSIAGTTTIGGVGIATAAFRAGRQGDPSNNLLQVSTTSFSASGGFPYGSWTAGDTLVIVDEDAGIPVCDAAIEAVDLGSTEYYIITLPERKVFQDGVTYGFYPLGWYPYSPVGAPVPVTWVECAHPYENYAWDGSTLPQVITQEYDDTGTTKYMWLRNADWDDKTAGDIYTNPQPNFVGRHIEDLAIFQNRLVALKSDEVITTETDNTRSWYRNTASQLLDSHPVRIRSTSAQSVDLFRLVQHNKDLMIFGKQRQFKLPGSVPLTPGTAGLPQTTAFNVSPDITPVSSKSDIYFPFTRKVRSKTYVGIAKYAVNEQDATVDTVDVITEHVSKYIPALPDFLLIHPNLGLLVAIVGSEIYVCDYDVDITTNEFKRYAWSKWIFKDQPIVDAYIREDKLYITMEDSVGQIDLFSMELARIKETDDTVVYLDSQMEVTETAGVITIPSTYWYGSSALKIIHGSDSQYFGAEVQYTRVSNVFTITGDYDPGSHFIVGLAYTSSFKPSKQYIRDEGGKVNPWARLSIVNWVINLVNSGDVYASVVSPYTTYDDQYWSGLKFNDLASLTDTRANKTGQFIVSFNHSTDIADLEIRSERHLPMNISDINYLGNYSSKGRRF